MLEYVLLIGVILLVGGGLNAVGIHSAWAIIPIILLTIPSIYAIFTGSPYLPTDRASVQQMIQLAEIKPGETVYDLGCGDGRILRDAAALGAKTAGYELSLYLCGLAKILGSGDVRWKNFWNADLRDADVVFIYLENRFLARFEKEIWPRLKPGCRVISNTFPLPTVPLTQEIATLYRYDKEDLPSG